VRGQTLVLPQIDPHVRGGTDMHQQLPRPVVPAEVRIINHDLTIAMHEHVWRDGEPSTCMAMVKS
jgi:hypothetical protein